MTAASVGRSVRWIAAALAAFVSALGASAAPTIVLKLDDLSDASYARAGFARAFEVLERQNVRGSFGLITRACVDDGKKAEFYAEIRRWAESGRVEIWHHGWDHERGEFHGSERAYQEAHLRDGLALVQAKCGVALRTFGAPFGETDATTVAVLNATPDIVAWFAAPGGEAARPMLLSERAPMEVKTGVVSYERFVEAFGQKRHAPYLVVLGHPPYWDEASHAAFARVVEFCRQQGCAFATPVEMAEALRGAAAQP